MYRRLQFAAVFVAALFVLAFAGCESEPKTPEAKAAVHSEAQTALQEMIKKDPSTQDLINRAYGYVIFPSVGKGGFIVGGAYGQGEVYEQGRLVGHAELSQASVGAQAGGQTYAELVVFETPQAMSLFKTGNFSLGANASAIAIKSGAGAATQFNNGVAVLTMPEGGLMFEASVAGQKFTFHALEQGPATRPAPGM